MTAFSEQLCDIISLESGLTVEEIRQAQGLMSTGILDSFALVALISMVETHLGHEVPPSDLTFENFDSVAAICAFVGRVHVCG